MPKEADLYLGTKCLLFIFILIILFTTSFVTIRRLSSPQAIQAHINERQRQIRARRTKSAVSMVLASSLLYTCCWLPSSMFIVLDHFHLISLNNIFSIDLRMCVIWRTLWFIIYDFLPALSSCLSPFIYIIFLPDFKQAARKVLCWCKRRQPALQEQNENDQP